MGTVDDVTRWAADEGPAFLQGRRWFSGKARTISSVWLDDAADCGGGKALARIEVAYADGGSEAYLLPFRDSRPDDLAAGLPLAEAIAAGRTLGRFRCVPHGSPPSLPGGPGGVRPLGAEQSNTSLRIGDRLVLKLFRRLQPGPNPEMEVNRFLAAAGFPHIPPFHGWADHGGATVAVLQGFLPNDGDGWTWTLAHWRDPGYFEAVRVLGGVTAELHAALAGLEPAEPITAEDVADWERGVEADLARFSRLPAAGLRARAAGFHTLIGSPKTRVHGDYHLGQVLRVRDGFAVLDFEGEPARPVAERRAKSSPLRDVAGMLRSLAYARHATGADAAWEADARSAFLRGYSADALPQALAALELEKALYELRYETANRPDWAAVPLDHLTAEG